MGATDRADIHQAQLVSIVIPTLNEEAGLPGCLECVSGQGGPFEVIVVDGGSTDSTTQIAQRHGARVVACRPGRALQMNAGAQASSGEILLFLHADCRLPADALLQVRKAIWRGLHGGAFTMRFDTARPSYRIAAALADVYCAVTRDFFGDRAIFATREAFQDVGGYRETDLMEDLDFAARLRRKGHSTGLVKGPVTSSARRFEKVGIWRGLWWAWKLVRAFHAGRVPDPEARRFYCTLVR